MAKIRRRKARTAGFREKMVEKANEARELGSHFDELEPSRGAYGLDADPDSLAAQLAEARSALSRVSERVDALEVLAAELADELRGARRQIAKLEHGQVAAVRAGIAAVAPAGEGGPGNG